MKIKDKVLKEVRNSGWSPELDIGINYVEQAIDLTIPKVQREQLEGFIQFLEEKSEGKHHTGTDVRLHHALMLYRDKVRRETLAEVGKVIKEEIKIQEKMGKEHRQHKRSIEWRIIGLKLVSKKLGIK